MIIFLDHFRITPSFELQKMYRQIDFTQHFKSLFIPFFMTDFVALLSNIVDPTFLVQLFVKKLIYWYFLLYKIIRRLNIFFRQISFCIDI